MTVAWSDGGKRFIRSAVAASLRFSGGLARAERRMSRRLVILCYHRILPAGRRPSYAFPDLIVTEDAFRREIESVRARYDIRTLSEALILLDEPSPRARPLAVISFDDGYRDNHAFAAPILRELGVPGTFFVIAGLIDSRHRPWYDRLAGAAARLEPSRIEDLVRRLDSSAPNTSLPSTAPDLVTFAKTLSPDDRSRLVEGLCGSDGRLGERLDEDLIMTWAQLRDLRAQGHEIGSHSLSHPFLTQLPEENLTQEVAGSKRVLEEKLGSSVDSFCYPNGEFDQRVTRAVATVGYRCAVTVETGDNDATSDRLCLKRRFIHEGRLRGWGRGPSSDLLRMELAGLADTVFLRR